jgi:methyl-accepting chemotaxis protein
VPPHRLLEEIVKLQQKMIVCMGGVFALFIVALAVALLGMQNAKTRFEGFLEEDVAILQASSGLYAQGLQMGQALRNVVLNPDNKTGYSNLENAAGEFKKIHTGALAMAAADTNAQRMLKEVAELRDKQAGLQAKIVGLAKDDAAAAIETLNKEETPVWRDMRGRLLDFIKAKNADVKTAKAEVMAFTQKMQLASLVLGGMAIVIGGIVAIWLARNVMGQLGGEPDYATHIAHHIAKGDFTNQVRLGDSDRSSLLFAMSAMQVHLSGTIAEVRSSTDSIALASREIAKGNMDLSGRTEDQASSLGETAASMEQLTQTVKQNADNARQANRLVTSASDVAVRGGNVVSEVVNTMTSINESSKKIVDIIGVIDGIAFQTNILALNAAVEAARAGEHGRGFAVVATEVRALAQRSAGAAKEIKTLISDSVDKVDTGSRLVDQAGATMQEIVASVQKVADIMNDITQASDEQSSGIEQVNEAIARMDDVTQQNAALVEEAAAAAQSLEDQAGHLEKLVSNFKLGVRPAVPADKRRLAIV